MNEIAILLQSPATLSLLVANVVVSLMAFQNARLMDQLLFDIHAIRKKNQWRRMITSGFIHGDGFHLFMNMLALYFMGPFLEIQVGTPAFLGIYLLCLLAGSGWTFMEHFRDMNYKALGASGAVSGITTAAALFAPLSTIYVFFALPMPFILFAALYLGWSAWASATRVRDGIGHSAHLGGALMGLALVCLLWPQVARDAFDSVVAAITPG
jgi:membrane associated rhomboid family serine protease